MTGVRRTEGQGRAASTDTEEGEPHELASGGIWGGLSERKEPGRLLSVWLEKQNGRWVCSSKQNTQKEKQGWRGSRAQVWTSWGLFQGSSDSTVLLFFHWDYRELVFGASKPLGGNFLFWWGGWRQTYTYFTYSKCEAGT